MNWKQFVDRSFFVSNEEKIYDIYLKNNNDIRQNYVEQRFDNISVSNNDWLSDSWLRHKTE